MQLTQFTDYSLRLLIYLARLPEPGITTIAEVAEFHQVSRNHLIKVAATLANEGYIVSSRGKGGGISLAKLPQAINLGDLVRKTELNMNLVECFDMPNNQCRLTRGCVLKGVLQEAQSAFMAVLDRYTLADAAYHGDFERFSKLESI